MQTYNKEYLLSKPPKIVDDIKTWEYVVNKLTDNGTKEISMGAAVSYYKNKLIYSITFKKY